MYKKTTQYTHYRDTLQKRKKKTFDKKLFHLHPIDDGGWGWGKIERFERWVMRDQGHLFRGSQNF